MNLDNAVVYDIETLPSVFTLNTLSLFGDDVDLTFEISPYRDDRHALLAWFEYWRNNETPMIGFNNLGFDYPVVHQFWQNPDLPADALYEYAMEIIGSHARFGHQVWESDRFAPQIDLFKLHHFDNPAKTTSLKALEISMRSDTVMEMPIAFDTLLTEQQVREVLIPYNKHDVRETRKFAHFSLKAIQFRMGLTATLQGDVLNFNDTKIGAKILEQRLGDELCYSRDSGRREPRQSIRHRILLDEIIFPYIQFREPEFNRILSWMRTQTLDADEITETIRTKGVFTGIQAHVGGIDFQFGTGGIHGSVTASRWAADDQFELHDIDVAGLYPAIAIVNGLYPEHLGERFVQEYARLPVERAKHKKGTVENSALKLASNGTYGNSNNKFSVFYDPRFTMQITINGQLLLCMLAEWLLTVPTLQIIQINTDGVTFRVHKSRVEHARLLQRIWQRITRLVLEETQYSRMWIRDVNNYIAEGIDGKLKLKGAYWYPVKFPEDISEASPPAWHKDFSAMVTVKAAVAHMTQGVDLARFVYDHDDPFDFMCRAKVDRSSKLMIGDKETQRITRYYLAREGGHLVKVSPPVKGARVGDFKRRNGISDAEYRAVIGSIPPGTWDERIHTKNRSKYEIREMAIESGYKVAECNRASDFDFNNVNYDWYIEAARKLVIA